DPRIAVIEPEQPDPPAEPGEPSAEPRVALEDEAKIAADDLWIRRERFVNSIERAVSERAVGMKEEQHVTVSRLGPDDDPGAPAGWRDEAAHSETARGFERAVLAVAIHNNHLIGCPLSTNSLEQRRQRTLFVQGRNDYRDHRKPSGPGSEIDLEIRSR